MAPQRLNVSCFYCERIVMRVNRIESAELARLCMHLRAEHPSIRIDRGSRRGVLKHFAVRERNVKPPSDAG